MRIGIGHKLVALLVVTAVLPLLAALSLVTWEWRRLRVTAVGNNLLTAAAAQAAGMEGLLRQDLSASLAYTREDAWIAQVMAADALPALSPQQAQDLDRQWPSLNDQSPPVHKVLSHPLSDLLRHFCRTVLHCREAFITDQRGYLLAATNKTSDFIQSDEDWWQHAYADGRGAADISEVTYDASAGVWAVSITVPIYARSGDVIGVMKVVLDLAQWIEQTRRMPIFPVAQQLLVTAAGQVVFADGLPVDRTLERGRDWPPSLGWRLVDEQLQAYAPIDAGHEIGATPIIAPRWFVVMEAPAAAILTAVNRMAYVALGVGLLIIAAAFSVGVLLFHRQIVWPLERLRAAADRIALGDFSSRVESGPAHRISSDEIGQLTRDFNRMAAEVERSYRAMAVANETRERFIRIAGHELRTPVTYIVAMADLLARSQGDPARGEQYEKLRERAFQLERMITGMFTLLDEGRLAAHLKRTQFEAAELVEEVAREMRPFAERRGQKLEVRRPAEPVPLVGDRGKLHDALANLAGNAIKFTPDGGTVTLEHERLGDRRIAFNVTDQGQGISDADLPHIFEVFWGGGELLRHTSGEFGYQQRGPGLGLSIAQEFARLHGGGIRVNNTPHGCTFSLIVPLEPGEKEIKEPTWSI